MLLLLGLQWRSDCEDVSKVVDDGGCKKRNEDGGFELMIIKNSTEFISGGAAYYF